LFDFLPQFPGFGRSKIFQAMNLGKPLQHLIIAELDAAHIDMDRTLDAATS